MKKFAWLIGVGILALVIGVALSRRGGPPTVEVVRPLRKNVTRTLAVTGQVEAIANASLSSTLPGLQVRKILVDKGDRVEVGQIVMLLDDRELRAAVSRTAAQVKLAEANLLKAKSQLQGAGQSVRLATQALDDSTELRNQRDTTVMNAKSTQARLTQAKEAYTRTREGARQQAVRASQAQLRRVEAQQRLAAITLKRSEQLLKEGAVAQADYDIASTNYENALESVKAAKEEVAQLAEPRTEDVRQAEAAVREAEAALSGAQAMQRNAERAYKNRISMRQSLTQMRTEQSVGNASVGAAEADLMKAHADLEQAQAQLSKTILRAPVTGVVTDRKVEPGETVAAGNVLLAFAAPKNLRIRVDVDETNLHDMHLGQKAIITPDAYPDLRLEAVVSEIVPSANKERGTVEVRLTLKEPSDKLLPQLTTDVNIVTGIFPNALTLSRSAVLDMDTLPRVLLVSGGKIEERAVKIESGETGQVVVLSGLTGDEEVLVNPATAKVGDTVKVKPAKRETQP